MPITGVGTATFAAGNNAAVTPVYPTGVQTGDLILAIAGIREHTATINIPSGTGWFASPQTDGSQVPSFNTTAVAIREFWKIYTAGDANPTFTFSGGGSNDTTIAVLIAFRGADRAEFNGSYIREPQPSYESGTATYINGGSSCVTAYKQGSVWLSATFVANDVTGTVDWGGFNSTCNFSTNPTLPVNEATRVNGYATSSLGADATIIWSYATSARDLKYNDAFGPFIGANVILATTGSVAQGVVILEPATIFDYTPSGGIKAGGAADALFIQVGSYEPTGGIKAGGSATTSTQAKGIRRRTTTTYFSNYACAGTSFNLTLTIPAASLQVDDLLIVHVGIAGSQDLGTSAPDTPAGWNYIPFYIGGGAYSSSHFYWKRWTAGDSATSVTFTKATTSWTKYATMTAWWNVDWTFNGGNPFTSFQRLLLDGSKVWTATLPAISAPINDVIAFTQWTLAGSGSNLITPQAAATSDRWVELYDQTGGTCGSNFDSNCWLGAYWRPSNGSREVDFNPVYNLISYGSTALNGHQYNVAIAGKGDYLNISYSGDGGFKGGGNQAYYTNGPVEFFAPTPSGGIEMGGSDADYYKFASPYPPPPEIYAASFFWDSAGRQLSVEGQFISLKKGTVELNLIMITSRRYTTSNSSVNMTVFSTTKPCNVNDQLTLSVQYKLADGSFASAITWTATVFEVKEVADNRWSIRATESGLRVGGSKVEEEALVQTNRGIRIKARFDLVAGDIINGITCTSIVTTAMPSGQWFSEVAYYGQS